MDLVILYWTLYHIHYLECNKSSAERYYTQFGLIKIVFSNSSSSLIVISILTGLEQYGLKANHMCVC